MNQEDFEKHQREIFETASQNADNSALTLEDITFMSKFGRIKSLRPLSIEYDFTILDRILTEEEQTQYQTIIEKLSRSIPQKVEYDEEQKPYLAFDYDPEKDYSTQEGFIDFFSQFFTAGKEVPEPIKKSLMVLIDEKTALSIISDDKIRKDIKKLGIPGQMRWDFDETGSGVIASDQDVQPQESQIQKVLNQKKDTQGYNIVLLQTIGTGIEAIYQHGQCGDDDTVHISRSGLQKHLGIKIRKPKKEDIDFLMLNREPKTEAEKKQYQDIMKHYPFWIELINLSKAGTMQTRDGIFTVFNFKGYNEIEDTIECSSPFLYHAYMELYANPIKLPMRNNQAHKIIKTVPPVVKGSLYTLKNKQSVEIIEELLYRLADRGTQADAKWKPHYNFEDNKKVTIKVTYKDLLKESSCPALHHSFFDPITKKDGTTAEPDTQYKRMVLKRAVFGENKLTQKAKKTKTTEKREKTSLIETALRDHTTLYSYYVDFDIKVDPISMKALNRTGITITHHGKSGDYQNDPELHSPEVVQI